MKVTVKIITDSMADLPAELIKKLDIYGNSCQCLIRNRILPGWSRPDHGTILCQISRQ